MELDQSSSVAMGGWVRAILPCPSLAEDLTIQTLPTRGLAVAMEGKFITKKVDPQVSVAEMVMMEDHLPWTAG